MKTSDLKRLKNHAEVNLRNIHTGFFYKDCRILEVLESRLHFSQDGKMWSVDLEDFEIDDTFGVPLTPYQKKLGKHYC